MEEPQMLLKKTIQKTKNFLHKTPHNLKSFFFGGHHKLPKVARQFNPFFSVSVRVSGSKRISKSTIQEIDDLYRDYYQQWHQPDHNETSERKIVEILRPSLSLDYVSIKYTHQYTQYIQTVFNKKDVEVEEERLRERERNTL